MRSAISSIRGRRPIASMTNSTPGYSPSASGRVRYASASPSAALTSTMVPCMPARIAGERFWSWPGTSRSLEDAADPVDDSAADDDLEQHAGDADDQADRDNDHVLEQDSQRQQYDAQGRERVETRERRSEEGPSCPAECEQPVYGVADARLEQEP